MAKKKVVYNNHHVIYSSDKNKEVIRKVRKGCHRILTLIRQYNFLTNEEADTIITEVMLKRKYDD